jgi:hypothetical protein
MLIFLQAYLAASIITLFRSKAIKILIYLFIYALFFIEISLEELYGMTISPNVLVLLIETNARESKEFLESTLLKSSLWHIPLYLCIAITVTLCLEKYRQIINGYLINTIIVKYIKYCSLFLLIGGFIFSYTYYIISSQKSQYCFIKS